jgi:amicyanin
MWGPYGYGGMGRPAMPGGYGKPGPYAAPSAYGQGRGSYAASAPAAPASAAQPADATESASVSISQMRFATPTVTIKAGGTVTWTNAESMPHTVTASNGSFDSPQLGAGDTFSHTFAEPGTYEYYCKLHPMMRATVVVVG